MAQYRGSVSGGRGQASRLGHKTTGMTTECNGWNVGVKCVATYNDKTGKDEILVYATSGSGYGGRNEQIAIIQEK